MGAHRDPDFQRRSTETGKTFRDQCNTHLKSLGFRLSGHKVIEDGGIEVDQVAVNAKGREIYFEFKGGYEGHHKKGAVQCLLNARMRSGTVRGYRVS
jgi:hypothetical protein